MNPGPPAPQAGILDQTRPLPPKITAKNKGIIIQTLIKAKSLGKAESTLIGLNSILNIINRNTNLLDPEQVRNFIANLKVTNQTKQKYATLYNLFCEINNIRWQKPRFKYERKPPLIPTTQDIDLIISASTPKYSVIFTLLKECGMEAHELHTVNRKDINLQKGTIALIGCKGHNSRILKLKQKTVQMLSEYLAKYPQEKPFPKPKIMSQMWRRARKKASQKLNKPHLENIPMRNLRHHYATTLYDKTKDILLVKHHLGHKKLETTMYYTTLITYDEEQEYTCKTATTIEQATQLIEQGFTYVTEIDGIKLFRKRK